ncbi:TPA: hypothetical protein DCR49_03135 [Candidatus Delongbacteria bacterium]|nr:hypothetical protein [Candidatus Delongbacteria bacterium]
MFYRMIIILLFLSAGLFSADFFSYYADFTQKLYQDKKIVYESSIRSNGWDRIFSLYIKLYEFRLQKPADVDKLYSDIDDVIEDIDDNVLKGLTSYEKEFLTASLHGSLAYIKSSDPSFGMFRNIRKSKNKFEELNKKYKTADTAFGSALTEIALGMYFQNSFWVNSILGYNGNILKGQKELDLIAFNGNITKIEANLFLIEYFGMILKDHNSAIKYSKNLCDSYHGSKYFKYLYAWDLFHTGKIQQAYLLFKDINSNISNRFYAYQYESIIYEAKCLYLTGKGSDADEVISYASKIHDGYIIQKFKNEWRSSVKLRQEAIFRPQYAGGINLKLSDDELKRTADVYFDHGFFRETVLLAEGIKKTDPEILVLRFRTAVIMQDWKKADRLYNEIDSGFEEFLDSHPDRTRLEVMKNIVSNHLDLF